MSARIAFESYGFRYEGSDSGGVHDIDLVIEPGEFVVLTGRSGCGKSTLIRAINGLVPHFHEGTVSGTVTLDGEPIPLLGSQDLAARIGSVFQDPRSQFFTTTVDDEVAFGCENLGRAPEEIRQAVSKALAEVGIEQLAGQELFGLSSGQKQLVAIASVLAMRPGVLVLDEPSANLDARSTAALAALLGRLQGRGHTIVVAEHRLDYLLPFADRVVRLAYGALADVHTPEALLALSPARLRVLGLRDPRPAGAQNREASAVPPDTTPSRLAVREVTLGTRTATLLPPTTVDVDAGPGRIVGITGAIGSGKTTLARILCGLRHPTAGDVLRGGVVARRRRLVADAFFVMQDTDYQLFSDTVLNELRLSAPTITEEQAEEILDDLGLAALRDAHPLRLSGGQKQRVAIACAVASAATVLVFDEPTSGLDADSMRRVADILRRLASAGRLVIVTSHDEEFLTECAAHRIVLDAPQETFMNVNLHKGASVNPRRSPSAVAPASTAAEETPCKETP